MIIDAFMFYNEVELLEVRLNELARVVDKFVIVESLESHGSGTVKPLGVLHDNWSVVLPFVEKIHYTLLPRLEPPFDGGNSWPRENYNRNALMRAASEVSQSGDDIMMVSDCDEIPRASAVSQYLDGMYALGQDLYFYDARNFGGEWHGTVIGPRGRIEASGGPQGARNRRDSLPVIAGAGWHFSYFGGVGRIRTKTENFAHAPEDVCRILRSRTDEELAADVRSGRDLYHREGVKFVRGATVSPLPEYLLRCSESLRSFMGVA